MPLKWFLCPDGQRIETQDCLKESGCRMGDRCATRSYLRMASSQRPWTGKPSTTQLIKGTMQAYLEIKHEYATSPDSRAFMINGTRAHANLENYDDEYSLLEEKFLNGDITGIADVYEQEKGYGILADYKTTGSYKIQKALGFYTIDEPTGEFYKTGKRRGQEKTRKVLKRDDSKIDVRDWTFQLNRYRMELEKRGMPVNEIRVQAIVRDGGTYIARSRGVFRNIYYFKIPIMPDQEVSAYFEQKKKALEEALKIDDINKIEVCNQLESWDGVKCTKYCDVAEFCPLGKYLKREKESDDMAIKNLSEIRRLPRLGKIRLGVKKTTQNGKEYPAEVDYFIIDPQTPIEAENKKIIEEFQKIYGEKPKQIKIMFPVSDPEVFFPQFYKRYGASTMLQCKGDGATAVCATEEFAKGLEIIGKDDLGLTKVKCAGKDCPYYKNKSCSEVATLNVLLPELPGAGVWQISTGSFHSIVNMNSCIAFVQGLAGRAHMIPLTLERRMQEISYEGKKAKHYILHINMDIRLAELQKLANIDSTKILLELPEPHSESEDIIPTALIAEDPVISSPPENNKKEETETVKKEVLPQKEELFNPIANPVVQAGVKNITQKAINQSGKTEILYNIMGSNGQLFKTKLFAFADIARKARDSKEVVSISFSTKNDSNGSSEFWLESIDPCGDAYDII